MGALVQTVAPAEEPVTRAEAKQHSRIDITDDDGYIDDLIVLARQLVEEETSRRLVTQTYQWILNDWPAADVLQVPIAPLSSVTSIVYTNSDDVATTFSADSYIVDTSSEPARIVLKSGVVWPISSASLKESGAIVVTMIVGYGLAVAVPKLLKQAIKFFVSNFYENREPAIRGAGQSDLRIGITRILTPFSTWNQFASAKISQEAGS